MRVAVFTGSATGPESHVLAAGALARHLAKAGVGIVYGGGAVGLMGVVADAALAAGGEVVGVMPRHLVEREIAHKGLARLDVVADMHERKARMAALADAFIALPGGAGTLEELFEAWTWTQLGLHHKPVALLDIDGFFDPLMAQLRSMAEAGYIGDAYVASLGVVGSAAEFLAFADTYSPPPRKWTASLESVGWVCVRDGRLLTVRTTGRDRFYLPGGKIEANETLETALLREVDEELGLALSRVRSAFTVRAPAHGLPQSTDLTMHCFYADHDGEPQPSREIAEVAWLELDDTERAAPAVQKVLRLLASAL